MIIIYILIYWNICAGGMIALRAYRKAYEEKNNQRGKHKPVCYAILLAPLAFPCLIGLCLYFLIKNKDEVLERIKYVIDNITEE